MLQWIVYIYTASKIRKAYFLIGSNFFILTDKEQSGFGQIDFAAKLLILFLEKFHQICISQFHSLSC